MIPARRIRRPTYEDVAVQVEERICNPLTVRLSNQVTDAAHIQVSRRHRPTGRLPRRIWQAIEFQAWEDFCNDPG